MKKVIRIIPAILMVATIVSCKKKDIEAIDFSEIKSNPSVRYRVINKSAAIRDYSSINSKIVRTESAGEVVNIDPRSVSEGIPETVEGKAGRWLKLTDSSTPCFVFSTEVKSESDLFKAPFSKDNEIVYKKYYYGENCSGDGFSADSMVNLEFKDDNVISFEWKPVGETIIFNGKYQKIHDHVYVSLKEKIVFETDESNSELVKEIKTPIESNLILKFMRCPEEGHSEMLLKTFYYNKAETYFPDTTYYSNGYWREGNW